MPLLGWLPAPQLSNLPHGNLGLLPRPRARRIVDQAGAWVRSGLRRTSIRPLPAAAGAAASTMALRAQQDRFAVPEEATAAQPRAPVPRQRQVHRWRLAIRQRLPAFPSATPKPVSCWPGSAWRLLLADRCREPLRAAARRDPCWGLPTALPRCWRQCRSLANCAVPPRPIADRNASAAACLTARRVSWWTTTRGPRNGGLLPVLSAATAPCSWAIARPSLPMARPAGSPPGKASAVQRFQPSGSLQPSGPQRPGAE